MGSNVSRTVEIQISNNTRNITLENPRTYFYSANIISSPQSSLSPGSSATCKFTNVAWPWGCSGVLAFEAKSFTLAIYFYNPIDYNLFSAVMGLELSLDKVHRVDLKTAFDRLVRISSDSSDKTPMFPSIILKEPQEQAQLSAGPVKVTATMSRSRNASIRVEIEEQRNSGNYVRMETLYRARHVQEK